MELNVWNLKMLKKIQLKTQNWRFEKLGWYNHEKDAFKSVEERKHSVWAACMDYLSCFEVQPCCQSQPVSGHETGNSQGCTVWKDPLLWPRLPRVAITFQNMGLYTLLKHRWVLVYYLILRYFMCCSAYMQILKSICCSSAQYAGHDHLHIEYMSYIVGWMDQNIMQAEFNSVETRSSWGGCHFLLWTWWEEWISNKADVNSFTENWLYWI